jgi:hypothetical protein
VKLYLFIGLSVIMVFSAFFAMFQHVIKISIESKVEKEYSSQAFAREQNLNQERFKTLENQNLLIYTK